MPPPLGLERNDQAFCNTQTLQKSSGTHFGIQCVNALSTCYGMGQPTLSGTLPCVQNAMLARTESVSTATPGQIGKIILRTPSATFKMQSTTTKHGQQWASLINPEISKSKNCNRSRRTLFSSGRRREERSRRDLKPRPCHNKAVMSAIQRGNATKQTMLEKVVITVA